LVGVSGDGDDAVLAAGKEGFAGVEAQATLVLIGAVALDALIDEDRPDAAFEELEGGEVRGDGRGERGETD